VAPFSLKVVLFNCMSAFCLVEGDTSCSETRDAATTNLDTADRNKPDVNIDMDKERLLSPARGTPTLCHSIYDTILLHISYDIT